MRHHASVRTTGASYYGIGDLEALARDTHKFESRYLDGLIGPYPGRQDIYRDWSPVRFVERLTVPIVFFQGAEDPIVPPSQAEAMVAALKFSTGQAVAIMQRRYSARRTRKRL